MFAVTVVMLKVGWKTSMNWMQLKERSDNAAIAAFRERYLASIEEEYHNAIAKVEI